MTGYLDNFYLDAVEQDQIAFKALLEMPDPELFALLIGTSTTSDKATNSLLDTLKSMVRQRR